MLTKIGCLHLIYSPFSYPKYSWGYHNIIALHNFTSLLTWHVRTLQGRTPNCPTLRKTIPVTSYTFREGGKKISSLFSHLFWRDFLPPFPFSFPKRIWRNWNRTFKSDTKSGQIGLSLRTDKQVHFQTDRSNIFQSNRQTNRHKDKEIWMNIHET